MLALTASVLVSIVTPVVAEQGKGAWHPDRGSVIARTGAIPLSRLGRDAIRFSASPSLGGGTFIIELHAIDDKRADGEVRFYVGHPALGWSPRGQMTIDLARAEYDTLVAFVDAKMSEPDPLADLGDAMFVCADGANWVTERRRAGQSSWLTGACGDKRSSEIHSRIVKIIETQVARYARK